MEGINPAPVGRGPIGTFFFVVFYPFIIVYEFFGEWLASRNWRWFFVSIPALLVGLLVSVALAQAFFSEDETLALQYVKQAQRAFAKEDYARAQMLYRKAAQRNPGDVEVVFAQGLCYAQMDRMGDAMRTAESVAPLDDGASDKRFLGAHIWLAAAAVERQIEVNQPLAYAEKHLLAVVREQPKHVEANRRLTNLAISQGNNAEALRRIPFIVDKFPDTRIIYAQLLDQAGRKEDAREQASKCLTHYQKTLVPRANGDKNRPTAGEWLNFAQAAVLLDQFNGAITILKNATKVCDDKRPLAQGAARVYVKWSQRLQADDVPVEDQLDLLSAALKIDPHSPIVLQRIAVLIGHNNKADLIAEDLLRRSLAEGKAPAIVHFILGTRLIDTDPKKAISHLEQARRLNGNIPSVLNNLGWVLMSQKDLKSAEKYARQAIRLQPSSPNFHETLGQVLIKKAEQSNNAELWRDAITELEIANKDLKDSLGIHNSLAKAYSQLGDDDYADEHRKLAEEIREKIEQKKKAAAEARAGKS